MALLAARGQEAWRDAKATRRGVPQRLDQCAAKAEATAERAAVVGDTGAMHERLGRLRVSLAQPAALREARDEAQVTFGRVTVLVARK